MAGISNQNLLNFLEEKTNDDIEKNFVGVFPSNFITKFMTFHRMTNKKSIQYLFIIMNTDRSDKNGMHWWSCLDLHPKNEIFLFNSFGFDGFKEFLLQDDKRNLIKFSMEFKNLKKKMVIMAITLTFSMEEYKKIKTVNRLSETT